MIGIKKVEREKVGLLESLYIRILDGFMVTIPHILRRKVTIKYPEKKREIPEPYRAMHSIDIEKCLACELCATICPSQCILIVAEPHPEKLRHPKAFNIDILKCTFCGFCQDVCPTGALQMTSDWNMVGSKRFVLTIEDIKTRR